MQVGHHGAEKDGAADRGKGVLGAHENRGRRVAAHALKRRQYIGQNLATLVQRGAQHLSSLVDQRLQALFGAVAGRLELLNLIGGVDQRLVEGGAVLVE